MHLGIIISLAGLFYVYRISRMVVKETTEQGINQEVDTLARTLYGEARGEGVQGMQAVANVIANRVKKGGWWGATFADVCLKPSQFSCWLKSDPNYAKLLAVDISNPSFKQATDIATLAVAGRLADLTNGATHYHTKQIKPKWADSSKIVANVGNHIFYRGIA